MRADRLRAALRGRHGAPLRAAYQGLTAAQLRAVVTADRVLGGAPDPATRRDLDEHVTVAMKTFMRPDTARRCVRSLRRVFGGRIVVADDSRTPMAPPDDRVDVLPLPFNVGVPAGRNAALDAVETEFVLVTDDDIVFTAQSRIDRALATLREHPEIDVVGFMRVELPRWYALAHHPDPLFPGAAPPLRAHDEVVGGLPVRLFVEQLYLARTASLRRVRWNERLRMVDHRDFFSRASGTLLTVYDESIVGYHARTPFDAEYTHYRDDVAADLQWLAQHWVPGRRD